MATTTVGRSPKIRNSSVLGAAVTTAAALAVGLATSAVLPDANAVTYNAVTTGPLFGIANVLGVDTITIPDVPGLGSITVNFAFTNPDPTNLYDQINAFPFGSYLNYTAARQPGGTLGAAILGGSGRGAYQAGQAYEALLASAAGNTPSGYTPLTAAGKVTAGGQPCDSGATCQQGTNQTNLALALVNNPGTPNGGLYARFNPILNLFGIDGVTPPGASASSTGIELNTAEVGLAQGYGAMSDFPVTLNPFAVINSLFASVLPTYLAGGGTLQGDSTTEIGTKVGLLVLNGISSTSYSTFAPNDLPLLEPLRLPARVLNAAFNALGVPITVPTLLADALQPAAEILVNIGYTDVQTPSAGGTYNRTYDQSGTYTPYLSVNPLTPAEWAQVPGDVVGALINGFLPGLAGAARSVPATSARTSAAAAVATPATSPRVRGSALRPAAARSSGAPALKRPAAARSATRSASKTARVSH